MPLRDAGAYHVVALRDLVDSRFGGNRYSAMATLRRLEREGLVQVARVARTRPA